MPFAVSLLQTLRRLGGIGLMLLGVIDSSPVPMLGGLDILIVVLAARNRQPWFYYAAMAIVGSEIGGFITYRLGRKAGEEGMERRLGRERAARLHRLIKKWGFGAVAVPAALPPPFPLTPFLLFAGATQYSQKKFLAAFATGRAVKYPLIAFLASVYGRRFLMRKIGRYEPMVLAFVIFTTVGIALLGLWAYMRTRQPQSAKQPAPAQHLPG
jgi:membrane protein YqaA with SNARE-associated domain